jgi:ubiquinone/menaquinone biosynthesis C-methylase UbiE
LVATDLNEPMIRNAAQKFRQGEAVEWQRADASSLPFDDESFDAVVCQFGIMFLPDKTVGAREARRVLKSGGVFLFNVWDAMELNDLGRIAHETITRFFEKDPPTFYQVPFGYHDQAEIKRVLEKAGFRDIRLDVVAKVGGASRPEDAAQGLVHGNPVAVAITERDPSLLPVITNAVVDALKKQFGDASVRAPMQAIVVEARA